MARVVGAFGAVSVRGSVGKRIFQMGRSGCTVGRRPSAGQPRSGPQLDRRSDFALITRAWRTLSPDFIAYWSQYLHGAASVWHAWSRAALHYTYWFRSMGLEVSEEDLAGLYPDTYLPPVVSPDDIIWELTPGDPSSVACHVSDILPGPYIARLSAIELFTPRSSYNSRKLKPRAYTITGGDPAIYRSSGQTPYAIVQIDVFSYQSWVPRGSDQRLFRLAPEP